MFKGKTWFEVTQINLHESSFSHLDMAGIAAIDLRDCRGWLRDIGFFRKELDALNKKIGQCGYDIPIINSPEMFEWIASKEYLAEFSTKDIPIVPTLFLGPKKNIPDIVSMMENNASKPLLRNQHLDLVHLTYFLSQEKIKTASL